VFTEDEKVMMCVQLSAPLCTPTWTQPVTNSKPQYKMELSGQLHAPAVLSLVLNGGLGTMAPILGTEPLPSNSKPVAVTHRHATCHFLTVACPMKYRPICNHEQTVNM
jgi:hypothetical protein